MTDLETAQLGIQAEEFKSSPIGKYLYSMAEEAIEEAKTNLIIADPRDYDTIEALQRAALIPGMMMAWIEEAIDRGAIAEQQIHREAYTND